MAVVVMVTLTTGGGEDGGTTMAVPAVLLCHINIRSVAGCRLNFLSGLLQH